MKETNLYDVDFYKWTKTQADLLNKKQLSDLDLRNLIDEIESLGRSEKRLLRSHITNLLSHLLKSDHQPSKKTKSWDNTINESLAQIQFIIDDSPSFKRLVPKLTEEAYSLARFQASRETGIDLNKFPEECPESYKEYLKFNKN